MGLSRSDMEAPGNVDVIVLMQGEPRDWIESVRSALDIVGVGIVHLACNQIDLARKLYGDFPRVRPYEAWSLAEAIDKADPENTVSMVLVLTDPVSVPRKLLERSFHLLEREARIASVSYLSNTAGFLSFPYRNTPTPFGMAGLDENGITAKLRAIKPEPPMVPISMPAGGAILLNMSVFRLCGGVDSEWASEPKLGLAQFALKAARRGFSHILDTSAYVTTYWKQGCAPEEPADNELARHRLHVRYGEFPALYDAERASVSAPLSIALDCARAKIQGLRVLIDGSCLGPIEMGTQVQTVCLIEALVARDDVARVTVGVPNGVVPPYATKLLAQERITFCDSAGLQFTGAEEVDILHRPFQPDTQIPWERWRQLAKRVVITVQDLIAYKIGSYHRSGEGWLAYRESMRNAVSRADAVVAISNDTFNVIQDECLDIGRDRMFVVKNGSDHLSPDESESIPDAILEGGLTARPFVLVLGASYTHKNRDLAIRVWKRLLDRGHDIALVMAGAQVPMGSSRQEEAALRLEYSGDLLSMPDVSSEERNWLLRHAALVIYPTSSEGFGLVPFEAASMGTPTVHVSFGPLKELIEDSALPVSWNVDELADYAQSLLKSPDRAEHVVRTILANAQKLTWSETASGLAACYRATLLNTPR